MSEKLKILEKIEAGQLSPEEGAQLLSEIEQTDFKSSDDSQKNLSDMDILAMVEKGQLSPDNAISRLRSAGSYQDSEESHTPPRISSAELEKWKRWWQIPLFAGVAIVTLSAMWINAAYVNDGVGFWFFFAWVPFMVGLLFIMISWRSQTGPWVHVRIKEQSGHKISISIPIPLGLAAWALRTFGEYIPYMGETSLDEIIIALGQTAKNSTPLYVNVQDDEDGDQVEVFIG